MIEEDKKKTKEKKRNEKGTYTVEGVQSQIKYIRLDWWKTNGKVDCY